MATGRPTGEHLAATGVKAAATRSFAHFMGESPYRETRHFIGIIDNGSSRRAAGTAQA